MPTTTKRPVLALDPGMRDLGYAVTLGKRLIIADVLSLRRIPKRRRLAAVREAMHVWMRAYRPRTLVLEHMPNRPLDNLAGLPALGRLLRRMAAARRIKVATYSARTVRSNVVGNGWAGKREVAEALSARFPDLRVHLTHDRKWKEAYWQNMYDAVALALHHQSQTKPPSRSR